MKKHFTLTSLHQESNLDLLDTEGNLITSEDINQALSQERLPTLNTLRFLFSYFIPSPPDTSDPELLHLLSLKEEIEPPHYSYPAVLSDSFSISYNLYGNTNIDASGIQFLRPAGTVSFTDNSVYHGHQVVSEKGAHILFATLRGKRARYYYNRFTRGSSELLTLSKNSAIPGLLYELRTLCQETPVPDSLFLSARLTALLTTLVLEKSQAASQNTSNAPSYIIELQQLFNEHFTDSFHLNDLANQYFVNKYKLVKDFKTYIGYSPIDYLINRRIGRAIQLLLETNLSVKEITFQAGFQSLNNFTKIFKQHTGLSPSDYRKQSFLQKE